jgi:hypothetical protein
LIDQEILAKTTARSVPFQPSTSFRRFSASSCAQRVTLELKRRRGKWPFIVRGVSVEAHMRSM